MDTLADLNPPQRAAVETVEGPLLILAGPGSGKTRVIAHRIAYLVDVAGVEPWRIVAVTFTNKAAREMRSRVEAHLAGAASELVLGTFHAICARLLRVEAERIGLSRSFNIFDDADQLTLMKRVVQELAIDTKRFKERALLSAISRAKSELRTADDCAHSTADYFQELVARCYERYDELLAENSALDFDDLIMKAVEMLRDNNSIREKYQDRFLHVLVDEFQDTNVAQYRLARLLAGKHGNICVVGDPDQSIYSWRSADIRNILDFERDFPQARIVLLEQNYRSTQTILDAAHAVIAGSRERTERSLWTDRGAGQPIVTYEAYDEEEEASFVAREIQTLADDGRALGDFAVMYRTNAQSRAIEEALIAAAIPYQLVGGTRFYERREIKDLLAYLRLVQNPFDVVSFTRVVNVPGRGIGAKTVAELERWAKRMELPLYTALQFMAEQESGRPATAAERHPVAPRQAKALVDFLSLLDGLIAVSAKNSLSTLLDAVLERTAYRKYVFAGAEPAEPDGDDDAEERWATVGELQNVVSGYDGIAPEAALITFLEEVALISDADTMAEKGEAAAGRVTLITLHSAKGLEYPVVFMTAMEEGVLPHIRSFDDQQQLEEERRLCYVGMTRAKERLYLVRAFRRYGMGVSQHAPPSRFLRDIPPSLTVQRSPVRDEAAAVERGPHRLREQIAARRERPPAMPTGGFDAGARVRHSKFGDGVVVSCVPDGEDFVVTIAFRGAPGIKKLMLSMASLELV